MCAGGASPPSSDRTPDRAPSKCVTLSTPPRRKPQPQQPFAGPPRGSPPTNPRCSVARRPPARPAPPARRPTITRPGQPLVVSKPAPGCALAAAIAALGALLPVGQYCRYWELDSSSTSSPPQPSMMALIRSHIYATRLSTKHLIISQHKPNGYTYYLISSMILAVTNGLRLQATQHLLHSDHDEGNHRDGEDNVRDEPVAVLGGHTLGVQEDEQSNRQEGQEKSAERGVDDHQQDRLSEGEQDHGRERHPGQECSEEDAPFGEVIGCLLVRHLADSAHTIGPEHGAGRDGPEADEECPACQEAESVLHGVYQRQETRLIAYGRACTEEQLRPDDQHRHHEQGG